MPVTAAGHATRPVRRKATYDSHPPNRRLVGAAACPTASAVGRSEAQEAQPFTGD
jgi:hypothetical protein